MPTPGGSPPRVARSSADRELLIQRVLEAVRSGRTALLKRSQELELGTGELMLCNTLPVGSIMEALIGIYAGAWLGGKCGPAISCAVETWLVFLLRTTGTWGEPMFVDGRVFPFSVAGLVSRCAGWPMPSITDTRRWTKLFSGKRGMVRAGGSASRIIEDRYAPDLVCLTRGGGGRVLGGGGNSRWGVPANLVGPRMSRAFQPWGATLRWGTM